jgi:hypothetical protein
MKEKQLNPLKNMIVPLAQVSSADLKPTCLYFFPIFLDARLCLVFYGAAGHG